VDGSGKSRALIQGWTHPETQERHYYINHGAPPTPDDPANVWIRKEVRKE